MSAETTPTSVTSGTSRPLVTRLVPTSTSARPSVKSSMTRGRRALAAPRRHGRGAPRAGPGSGRPPPARPARCRHPGSGCAPSRRPGSDARPAPSRRSGGSAAPSPRRGTRAAAGTRDRPGRSRSRGRARRWRAAAAVDDQDRPLARPPVERLRARPPGAADSSPDCPRPARRAGRRPPPSRGRPSARSVQAQVAQAPLARARPTLTMSGVALRRG